LLLFIVAGMCLATRCLAVGRYVREYNDYSVCNTSLEFDPIPFLKFHLGIYKLYWYV
jgi:hypothetical protein